MPVGFLFVLILYLHYLLFIQNRYFWTNGRMNEMSSPATFLIQAFTWELWHLFQKLCASFLIKGWSWNPLMWSLRPCTTCLCLHLQLDHHGPLSMGPDFECLCTHWAFHPSTLLLMQLSLCGFPILISNLPLGEPFKLSDAPGRMHDFFICAALECWALHWYWNRTHMYPQKQSIPPL